VCVCVCVDLIILSKAPETVIQQMGRTNPTFHDLKRLLRKDIRSKTRPGTRKKIKAGGIVMLIVL
jgi:hypothetical protein